MALWSRVFSGGVSAVSGCTPTACCNQTSFDQFSTKPTILDELPAATGSIAEAIGYWAEQLRRRLASTATIMASSETIYVITIRRGTRTDTVTWQVENQQGAYPLMVSYAAPGDSATTLQFRNIRHAIDWLVERLA